MKQILAAALGLAALAGTTESGISQQQAQQQTQSSQSGNTKINNIPKDIEQATRVNRLGGMDIFAGYGIPPHIYGMYHVRRGTHKRSNKRK